MQQQFKNKYMKLCILINNCVDNVPHVSIFKLLLLKGLENHRNTLHGGKVVAVFGGFIFFPKINPVRAFLKDRRELQNKTKFMI